MTRSFVIVAAIWLSTASVSVGFQNRPFSIAKTTTTSRPRAFRTTSLDAVNDSDSTALRIGIAGAGAIAFGTASILSKNGYDDVTLWSPSGKGTVDLVNTNKAILSSTGALKHQSTPNIALDAKELVTESDVLIVALPANGHKQVFDAIAPHLASISEAKHIIVSSHASLGALYLSEQLLSQGSKARHTITSWGTTVCTARRTSGQSVDVKTIRKSVDTCCLPEHETPKSLAILHRLFPDIDFKARDGLLAISLSNLNPQNHLAISMGNISRMDKGEDWYQFQNITPRIGGLLEGLDRERLEIADALGLKVKTVYEHLSLSFHVPIKGSISDMCQEIHKKGNDVYGPNVADTRYVTEDVPFGLALVVALGKLVGRPALLHESGLLICNAMYGRDFLLENDLLQAIEMDDLDLQSLKEAARTGELQKSMVPK